MAEQDAGELQPRRPRPTPQGRSAPAADITSPAPKRTASLVRIDQVQPSELVAAAGSAVVTAARLGRLLTRTGWRLARQLPGGETVEREVQRVGAIAARVFDTPQGMRPSPRPRPGPPPSFEEQRAADLIRGGDPAQTPLRNAMRELLERSVQATRGSSREYLFGTIMSQLVPDEARILAALSDGSAHAAADLVVRVRRRDPQRIALANASTIGRAVGVTTPDNVPTYLTRLRGFGLIDFGGEDVSLRTQYEILGADDTVRAARRTVENSRRVKITLVRKTVRMSALGREFWDASDPSRPALTSS